MIDIKLAEQFRRISNDDLENFNIDNSLKAISKKEPEKFDIRKYERMPGGIVKIIKKDKK
jgi:hypothetical protein